jgi:error-prone DNA polymerase
LVLSAGMMGCRGMVQHQGGVTHVIAERLTDLTPMLRRVGEIDHAFPLTTGRGGEAKHGGSPDQRRRGNPRERRARVPYLEQVRA